MNIFEKLDFYLAARVNSYLNTRKLVYSRFTDKKSWQMINIVQHSCCIKRANKKSWEYINGRKKFGTRRTQSVDLTDCMCRRKDLLNLPKWEIITTCHYDFYFAKHHHGLDPFELVLTELYCSSVEEKYNYIRQDKYQDLSYFICRNDVDDSDICKHFKHELDKKLKEIKYIFELKLKLISKTYSNSHDRHDREQLWNILKELDDINCDNLFDKLAKVSCNP